jgi:quercetin dioxygenase-like cupin family protein
MPFSVRNSKGYLQALPGIRQKTLSYGGKMLMVEFFLDKGSELPLHAHSNEQIGYLVKGHIILFIGNDKFDANPGDSWCVPGGIEHRAQILEDSIAVEVFSPVREDYLPKISKG